MMASPNNTNAAVKFVVPTITNIEKLYVRNVVTKNAANEKDLTINANNISGIAEIFSDRSNIDAKARILVLAMLLA